MFRRRLAHASAIILLFFMMLAGCSGEASAPSGGVSTLIPIELSSINLPENLPMGVGEIGGASANVTSAEEDDDDTEHSSGKMLGKAIPRSGAPAQATYWVDIANDQLDAYLGFMRELELEVGEDIQQQSGLTLGGAPVSVDHSVFEFPALNLDSDVDCSATCSGNTAYAPICMVVKVDDKRTMALLMHEPPTETSRGKGCFRIMTDLGREATEQTMFTGEEDFLLSGAYDFQSETDQELEIFWNTDVNDLDGNRVRNAHARIIKAHDEDVGDTVTTLAVEGTTREFGEDADLSFQGAWVAGSDRIRATLEVNGTTETDACTTFAGVDATGCVDVSLPEIIAEAEESDYTTETTVASSSGVVGGGMAAGDAFSIVIDADGTGRGWGKNFDGQLGIDDDDSDQLTPVTIPVLERIEAFSGGLKHSLAVIKDEETGVKQAWAWGENLYGQLGDGTDGNRRDVPFQIESLSNVEDVIAGAGISYFRLENGQLYASGANGRGQLGDGTTTNRSTPVRVQGDMTDVVDIATSGAHTLALRSDGTVFGWGVNVNGQLAVNSEDDQLTPVELPFENAVALAANTDASYALLEDGTIQGIGSGYLGDGNFSVDKTTPVAVTILTDVVAIDAATSHAIALKDDGTVWAWGVNSGFQIEGMIGDGTTEDRATPVQVSGLTDIVAIAAGAGHNIAIKRDGTVWAWGTNADGQLGDGTTTNRLTPVQVSFSE